MNDVSVMMSPEVAATDLTASVESFRGGVVSPVCGPAFSTPHMQYQERRDHVCSFPREDTEDSLPLPALPPLPTAMMSPATPHVTRLADFSAKLHRIPDNTTTEDIHQLLLRQPPRQPAEKQSLRLSFNPECAQPMQRNCKEGMHGFSRGGNCFVGDANIGKVQESIVLEDNDAPSILLHLKCSKCASDERILIAMNTSSVLYCPFCGFPQR
ncbi:hypothetical protein TraAM80_07785 [Trypanosoma rangeli]|uniref:Uncharacterized protein n=1 Tax=Trypanosoma rangeli TaxID=5698 RepID=A0A422N3X0_TRYRA|nr:uncharacterized protein TraAM80_07785 [Trypanosoma rangeli]RNF00144.1 hypothetical protein TraAM80_07785 [Trypanosoma rangeli]|eukprot:RNF00144.1 hypothetical protein TraAM80_07785 [Trypanosoma rangeli]